MAVDPAEILPRVQARRLDRSQQAAIIAAREAWADAGFTGRSDEVGLDARTGRGRHRHRHRRRDQPDLPARRAAREGRRPGLAAADPDEHAQRPGGLRRARDRRPGRRAHPGQRVRVRRRGDRLRPRPAPPRPGRRRPGRRHRGLHPPADDLGLRQHAGDEHPQRRARAGLAAVRQAARRVRARRRRRRARPRTRGRRPQARGRTPYAVLGGAGVTADSYDIVAPDPDGNGQRRAARLAIERAGDRPTTTSCTSTRTPRRPRPATAPRPSGSPTCSAKTPSSPRTSR